MKLYLVAGSGGGYDTFDAFVIAARTPERAVEIATKAPAPGRRPWQAEEIAKRTNQPEGILLGSFNAG